MRPNTKALFLESPTNPALEVLDIHCDRGDRAQRRRAASMVDNVFATPIWQSPLQLGADVVVYSATKHIDGQGRCLGGVILSSERFHPGAHPQVPAPDRPVDVAVQCLGAAEGAWRRWRSVCAQQTETAGEIADALARHPKISRLIYPGRADHPQAANVKKQMRGGSTLIGVRGRRRRQGGDVPLR